jgi:hypothetical protein
VLGFALFGVYDTLGGVLAGMHYVHEALSD